MKNSTSRLLLSILLALISIVAGCGGSGTSAPNSSQQGAIVGSLSGIAGEAGMAKMLSSASNSIALEGVKVQVEGNDGLSAITDASGNFIIEDVPPGTYNLIAETPVSGGSPVFLKKAGVKVLPGTAIALAYMGQEPAGALYGKVTIPGKTDHSGIFIYIPGPVPCGTYTDKSGAFILAVVSPGEHEVRAQMAGYEEHIYRKVKVSSGVATPMGTEALTKLAGSVNVEGTVGVAGASSTITLQAQLFPVNAQPGDYNVYLVDVVDGKFFFENVAPGPYTLKVGDRITRFQSGVPGASYGAVAEYNNDVVVGSNDMTVPAITLQPGSKVTSLSSDMGFNFDDGTFTVGENGDMFVKSLDYNPLAPFGTPQSFTIYSRSNNLMSVPHREYPVLADLMQVPTSGFVSSITVGLADMIVVKTSEGNYAKVLFNGYGYSMSYNHLSFQWQLQPDGAQRFDY